MISTLNPCIVLAVPLGFSSYDQILKIEVGRRGGLLVNRCYNKVLDPSEASGLKLQIISAVGKLFKKHARRPQNSSSR